MITRELEFSGSGDLERILRELFAALSGRAVPTVATRTEEAWREPTMTFFLSATNIDTAAETLIRIATSAGLTYVR